MQTNYKAGGLITRYVPHTDRRVLRANEGLVPLPWHDARSRCADISNQGAASDCAGRAMANWSDVQRYRRTCRPKAYDGAAVYAQALRSTNATGPGTTLEAAADAAIKLGIIEDAIGATVSVHTITTKTDLLLELCMHDVAVVGFDITGGWNRANELTGFVGPGGGNLGGHAVLVCQYDEDGIGFENSWGKQWAWQGFGRMTWKQFDEQFMYALALRW